MWGWGSHEEINKQKKEEEEDEDSIHVHRYTMKNNIQTHTHEVTLHTGNSFATDALLQTPAMTTTKISAPAAGCDTCCQLMAQCGSQHRRACSTLLTSLHGRMRQRTPHTLLWH